MNAPDKIDGLKDSAEALQRNLFQRINAVRQAIAYVQKDKEVSTGRGSYRAVTHDMVTAMVRKHLIEAGIVCFPSLVESATTALQAPAEGKSQQYRYEATYDLVFVNTDDPADRITVRIQAHAIDNADKAPGKALSYAKKYAVLKLFEIETGEDEESRVSEFDIEPYLAQMRESGSMADLQAAYKVAFKAAESAKDSESQKLVIKVKDARKSELSKVKE